MSFYMFDASLNQTGLPSPGDAAPRYLFVPDLGPKLWYGGEAPGQKNREALETEMWKVTECIK